MECLFQQRLLLKHRDWSEEVVRRQPSCSRNPWLSEHRDGKYTLFPPPAFLHQQQRGTRSVGVIHVL